MSLSAIAPVGSDSGTASVTVVEDPAEKSRGEKPVSAAAPPATPSDTTIIQFFDRRDWPRRAARAAAEFARIFACEGSIMAATNTIGSFRSRKTQAIDGSQALGIANRRVHEAREWLNGG